MRDLPENTFNHLLTLFRQRRFEEVVRDAESLTPRHADAAVLFNILGAAYAGLQRLDDAVASYKRALEIRPDYAEAHNNFGVFLNEQGAFDEAVASYRRALKLKPDYAEAHNNLGAVLWKMGALDEAAEGFRRALELRPDYAEANNNLGGALIIREALPEAAASLRRAVELKPDFVEAHSNLGTALRKMGALDEAVVSYGRALEIQPNHADVRAQKLYELAHMCDWAGMEKDAAFLPGLGVQGEAVSPFAMLSLEDKPARHRIRSEKRAGARYAFTPLAALPRPQAEPQRLRVGYFSADYKTHPMTQLMAGVLEAHDRGGFEIFAYSYGPDRQDDMRKRIVAAVDVFEDVRGMSDEAVAKLARTHRLDIAVDLKGYTNDTRSGIFAHRAAPIQINYLGYPGTMGAPFIDYIIADETVIPEAHRAHFTESIIYLPDSYYPTRYQVSDNGREAAVGTATRADFGLPEGGFVFCCFNNLYKIGPAEFDIWMRLLHRVEGSVLWLVKANEWAESNLKKEAEARGVEGERVVFADRLPLAEHLARHRHADLFLDTFNYNAHTTASDALWAGLPLVTKLGQGFAARVGGSLLKAVGLPELITETVEDYERLALALALDPARLDALKIKLAANRTTAPLFDTALFTRHMEDGYRQAYRLYFEDKQPTTIRVMP